MINKLKTIAVFGSNYTSIYRISLSNAFNEAAAEFGMNLIYINTIGRVGGSSVNYGEYELILLDHIDLDSFDGIIFDGEGYNVPEMAQAVIAKLRTAKCPVISISSFVEGFYNVRFDDLYGFRQIIEHLLDVHHFTRIGFMSGFFTHPDAKARLEEFRRIMKSRGLPEDGAGIFEGDFWFNKGEEAAGFFLSLPVRPEAIVCANDYMAISLISALKDKGILIPEDIAVTGFDGTIDGQEMILPHLTSATREQSDLAMNTLSAMERLIDGSSEADDICVYSKPIINHSCGCRSIDYRSESKKIDHEYKANRLFIYQLLNTESALMRLNKVDSLEKLEQVFIERAVNFGDYSSFFLMLFEDSEGRLSCDSDFTEPSGKFTPVIWVDRKSEYIRPKHSLGLGELIPRSVSDTSHSYLLIGINNADRIFGYAAVEMHNDGRNSEFYILWLMMLSMTLETLLKNDRIDKLIDSLENKSLSDELTGMLNRRGFYSMSQRSLSAADAKNTVCTFVLDMDGLKKINDAHGHHEGDAAIKAEARIISVCCDSGEISARTGGDEFYVFAPDYSEDKAEKFMKRIESMTANYNEHSGKAYKVGISCGYCTSPAASADLDELLKVSDARMYEQKKNKPDRRK